MRSLHYDLIRLGACVMIILMHSPLPMDEQYGPILAGLSYLTAPGIGLFFLVSGALLLRKKEGVAFRSKLFLQRRFSKVLIPTVCWASVGWLLQSLGIRNTENGVLWFMYVLAGLYLLAPILIRWLEVASRREVRFYLLLWALSLCYPYAKNLFDLDESDTGWIYYFHGYVGYFILGSYLSRYKLNKNELVGFWCAFLVFAVFLPCMAFGFRWQVDFYSWFWYLSMSVALQCVLWWKVAERIAPYLEHFRETITSLSKLSFGIYLVHILVMRNFLWKMSWMQESAGIVQILVCAILTFVLSALFCWCLSKWKYSKYIIGV